MELLAMTLNSRSPQLAIRNVRQLGGRNDMLPLLSPLATKNFSFPLQLLPPRAPHLDDLTRQIHSEGRQQEIEQFRITWIVLTAVLSVVGVVGGIGNILVIYAFRRNYSNSSSGSGGSGRCVGGGSASNLFIIILAAIDLTICLVDIPATLYWTVWQMNTFDIVCKLHVSLKAFFIPTSSLVLVLIAVDRFLIICFVPGIQMRPRTTLATLLLAILIGLTMAIPMGLHSGVTNEIPVATDDALMREVLMLDEPPAADSLPIMDNLTAPKSQQLFSDKNATTTRNNNNNYQSDILHGPCRVDERYIKNQQYQHYLLTVFVVFILMFVTITILYAIIFIFVWWRQRRWFRRYSSDGLAGGRNHNNNPSIKADDVSQTTTSDLGLADQVKSQINPPRQRKSLCISIQLPLKMLKKQQSASAAAVALQYQQQHVNNSVAIPLTTAEEECLPLQLETTATCLNNNDIGSSDRNEEFSENVDIELCPQTMQEKRFSAINTAQRKKQPQDRCVQSSIRRRRSGSESGHMKRRKPHIRTAQTLAIITITFIVSYMPYLLIINEIVWPTRVPATKKGPAFREHLIRFFFFLYFFNSAANPIIYSCMNVTFREEVIRILQRIRKTFIGSSRI